MSATDTPLPTIVTTSAAKGDRVTMEMSRSQLDALMAFVGHTTYVNREETLLNGGHREHEARKMAAQVGSWWQRVADAFETGRVR